MHSRLLHRRCRIGTMKDSAMSPKLRARLAERKGAILPVTKIAGTLHLQAGRLRSSHRPAPGVQELELSSRRATSGQSRLVDVALIARRDRKCVRLLARSQVERRW